MIDESAHRIIQVQNEIATESYEFQKDLTNTLIEYQRNIHRDLAFRLWGLLGSHAVMMVVIVLMLIKDYHI